MSSHDTFVRDFHDHLTRDPNACVEKGVERRLGDLPDPSREEEDDRLAAARALLARAEQLAATEFEQKLDIDLAQLALRAEIHGLTYRLNDRREADQLPRAGDQIGDGLFLMFVDDPRPAAERLADITARIEKVPGYCEALLGRLDAPVGRWVDIDAEKVEGLPSLFRTLQQWAAQESWPDAERLEAACGAARGALRDYATRLRSLPTTTQIHVGEQVARDIVKLRGIELSLDELHGIARRFLDSTRELIESLRESLTAKYELDPSTTTESLRRFLGDRYRLSVESGDYSVVIDRYERERERVEAFIRERDLFPLLENQRMKIMQTPPFMAPSIPAGAMMPPPPFREGVRTSMIYLTLSEERLDSHTELAIPAMMIHEGIPGHHLQLATASLHPSTIRRHIAANDLSEGWTTMLEDYMLDLGYLGDLTDEARFIGKLDLARIGARVAIDLYFMTGAKEYLEIGVDCDLSSSDPFEAAGSLLGSVTGFSAPRVASELNWYSQERGYPLSYLTGNHLVWQLKRDVEAKQAASDPLEVDRAFHRVFLEAGNMPVAYLRRVFAQAGLV